MIALPRAAVDDDLIRRMFGSPDEAISAIEDRARVLFPDDRVIVWEGDPATFQFSYVSPAAEEILGYAASRWTTEPTFWADGVVHPDDRNDAVAYCALATCKGADHIFEYRARHLDGSIIWLLDIVRVLIGPKRLPVSLRGAMFDVTESKRRAGSDGGRPAEGVPSLAQLAAREDAGR